MKVRSFNDGIPAPDGNRAIPKSNQFRSDNIEVRKIAGGNGLRIRPETAGIESSPGIDDGHDRIELSTGAAASAAPGSHAPINVRAPNELKNRFQGAIYTPQSIANKVTEIDETRGESKLARVHQKIIEGYYNNPEFIEKLAERLIEEFYFSGEKS